VAAKCGNDVKLEAESRRGQSAGADRQAKILGFASCRQIWTFEPRDAPMKKPKRKRTAAEKRARRERKEKYMTIFINGKQKRVPRPPMIEGMPVDEFIARNADPIWLHKNELWELMTPDTPDTPDEELES